MKYFAYVRVSSADQHEDRQVAEILNKYNHIDQWYTEKVSGATTNRPELQRMLSDIRKMCAKKNREDEITVVIHELSRLGRNTADLLTLVNEFQEMGVTLKSNKENIDTSSATGRMQMQFLATIAEFERNLLKERQAEGIAQAKRKGVYAERSKKFRKNLKKADYERLMRGEITKSALAEELDVTRVTLNAMIKRYEESAK